MTALVQSLKDNLERQVSLYTQLADLAEDKQQSLVKNSLAELESVTAQEELILTQSIRLEQERLAWAEQFGREIGKRPEDITIVELAEQYPELTEVRSELEQVIVRLQQLQEVNSLLLQQALSIVNYTVDLLTRQGETTYAPPGRKTNEDIKRIHILDRSV